MSNQKRLAKQRLRRRYRIRNQAKRTGRPRLSVFRSNKHISAQLIDDASGKTIAAASSVEPSLKGGGGGNVEAATRVGEAIGKRAADAGVSDVVFDRGGYRYHGRVAALAAAARENGLNF